MKPGGDMQRLSSDSPVTDPGPEESVPSSAAPAVPDVAATIFGANIRRATRYHDLLATVGRDRGFMGPREVPRLWTRHLLNCAVLGEAIDEGVTVIDIGSGAGLPGIPLALARPDLTVVLVEPLLKRSMFLGTVVDELKLSNCTVIRGRAEERTTQRRAGFADVVTSRAVAPLGKLTRWSLPLARKGGVMLAMKGESVREELERDAREIASVGGGDARIVRLGEGLLDEPTTAIRIAKIR